MSQYYQAAINAYQAGDFKTAAQQMAQHLKTDESNAEAWHMLGIMQYQSEQTAAAVSAIAKAVDLQPNNADFLNNYGLVLKANGDLTGAIEAYQKALQQTPNDRDVQLNLANVLMTCERFEEAAGLYRRLIHLSHYDATNKKEMIDALCHALTQLGNSAHQSGHFKLAEACFAEAVQLQPNTAHLLYNLANAERELGMSKQAADHYQQCIQRQPDNADAYNNLGNVQRELGRLDEAIKSYEKALQINPNLHHAAVHLTHQKQQACDWQDLNQASQMVYKWVNNGTKAQISPFAFLAIPDTTAEAQLKCANLWIQQRFSHLQAIKQNLHFDKVIKPKKKLKIAYLSADFRLHPLAFLITDLIECHDRAHFEIIAYSFGPSDKTPTRKRLVNAFDQFHEIQGLSEQQAAEKIDADDVDILVDLTGFTQTSRSGIAALRPAAIHVSWLGFAGTMGYIDAAQQTPLFDYLLTDRVITPPDSAAHYAEKLAYLSCYQPNDRQRPVANTPTRESCSLPENSFVYCVFNQSFKITPEVFASWMRILSATARSVLWLLDCHPLAKQNLITAASQHGIHVDRLIFAPRVAINEHLARHVHADLFLDTPIYNAHTTCSDALWMGVPVLTKIGETFASRVAASLLTSVGLPELIMTSSAAYEAAAIHYAQTPSALAEVETKLLQQKSKAMLFDTPAFTHELEAIYQNMWQDLVAGFANG